MTLLGLIGAYYQRGESDSESDGDIESDSESDGDIESDSESESDSIEWCVLRKGCS